MLESLCFLLIEESLLVDASPNIDGNGWSQRYGRLLSTGSVVFKSTVFPEWNTPWLIPYYHFVVCLLFSPADPASILIPSQPIKVDYSDLYDTMAFFAGYPNGHPGHDDIAEKIAANGMRFTRENWRWEDMQAYVRIFLALLRVLPLVGINSDSSPSRCSASYSNMHDCAQMTEMRRPSTLTDQ